MRNILIAAGGTGGHLYPAIVLAKTLQKKDCKILFVVRSQDPTRRMLELEKLNYVEINAAPIFGKPIMQMIKGMFSNFFAIFEAMKIMRRFHPDAAAGFGAYVSVPVVMAAKLRGIPITLHEQNPVPGWANKVCSRFSRRTAVSFPEAEKYFSNAFLTGNLLREELFKVQGSKLKVQGLKEGLKTILVFGGSAGAKSINHWIADSLPALKELRENVQWIHVTGSSEETGLMKKNYSDHKFQAEVSDYTHRIWDYYAQADLVICRAGATTITELIAVQIPAILIPYPHAGAHQTANAAILTRLGAAEMIHETSPHEILPRKIIEIIRSEQKHKEMKTAYQKFPVELKDAPMKLAAAVLESIR